MNNPKTRPKGEPDYAIGKRLRARPVNLDNNRGRGVQLRFGPFLATVTEGHAVRFANRIIDAIEAEPEAEPTPAIAAPLHTSRSTTPTESGSKP
ncbi:hypothetical protein [Paeniglutamicibacter psychrophenolicus]|uniref:hypothetical protein n=1 Tax=Paeniglutamicibacter psychrophenolicus TaxID=257454 RepID=UPI00277D4371|nr:hypothetical protein [Paeniglutamicibacter psychrophenolicus]MDQ0094411.1 hypothetical protein [Paeniglutamicibacter psychrophenolicus]